MQHIYVYLGQALRHVVTKIRYVYVPSQALRHAATLAFLWQIKPLGLLQSITTNKTYPVVRLLSSRQRCYPIQNKKTKNKTRCYFSPFFVACICCLWTSMLRVSNKKGCHFIFFFLCVREQSYRQNYPKLKNSDNHLSTK